MARETPAKCTKCGTEQLEQDNDVLDTWFSSGLLAVRDAGLAGEDAASWRRSTRRRCSITGFDILFFWVARMIMMDCHFMRRSIEHG